MASDTPRSPTVNDAGSRAAGEMEAGLSGGSSAGQALLVVYYCCPFSTRCPPRSGVKDLLQSGRHPRGECALGSPPQKEQRIGEHGERATLRAGREVTARKPLLLYRPSPASSVLTAPWLIVTSISAIGPVCSCKIPLWIRCQPGCIFTPCDRRLRLNITAHYRISSPFT